jgi:lipoprotein-anchoring transpeptidase ErfK/SrfK
MTHTYHRRTLLVGGVAALTALATPSLAQQVRNIGAFRTHAWQDHFESLRVGAIVADTESRALHFWNADASDYRVYPTSVPISEELTRRGYTEIVRKRVGPDWTPTQSQRERFGWEYIPPGPESPMGTHAMYLTWPAYAVHGTHDSRKIGRPSSDGCIGLYNEQIAELFALCPVGVQVRII